MKSWRATIITKLYQIYLQLTHIYFELYKDIEVIWQLFSLITKLLIILKRIYLTTKTYLYRKNELCYAPCFKGICCNRWFINLMIFITFHKENERYYPILQKKSICRYLKNCNRWHHSVKHQSSIVANNLFSLKTIVKASASMLFTF